MNKEIKTRWVAALREPNRTQTTGHLRNKQGGQCCLDVLCELAVADGVLSPPELDEELEVYKYTSPRENFRLPELEWETLPTPVIEWAGVPDSNPSVHFLNPDWDGPDPDFPDSNLDVYGTEREGEDCLAELNDTWQFNFAQIADIIEASDL